MGQERVLKEEEFAVREELIRLARFLMAKYPICQVRRKMVITAIYQGSIKNKEDLYTLLKRYQDASDTRQIEESI